MPVRLRQELQALPWGAGIVALSCGIRECFATCCPCSSVSASLLCSSTNFFTATIFRRPPKSKKVGQLPSLRQFQFFDPTGTSGWPKWHPQYEGFIGLIFFTAEDANALPLTTTKRSVDSSSALYQSAMPKMRDISKEWIA